MAPPRAILRPGREKALLRRHPWVFSGAISKLEGQPISGDALRIEANDGRFLGWGVYSASSQISLRVWSFREEAPIDSGLIAGKISIALKRRAALFKEHAALRLIHAEADGLPGVICDRYGDQLVLQLSSAGADRWRDCIVDAVVKQSGIPNVYERSDSEVLELEGLSPRTGALRGTAPEFTLPITEAGLCYEASVRHGHKTGFYLDQRDNRALVRALGGVDTVLDCFCYSGGFTVNALAAGAKHVTAIDSSSDALARAANHVALNAFYVERVTWIEDDVFKRLRRLRDQGQHFDLIVLDPPKFAPTAATVARAARGYKDINLLAFKLLNTGGRLLTFSCSGGVDRALFQKIIAGAALDAGVDAQIEQQLGAGADHPVALNFPEGDYLKGLLIRVA